MKKKLKTLGEANQERRAVHSFNFNTPTKNGISCPNCGEELLDSSPMMTLTSNPSKKNIHCESCDYKGYRIA